MKREKRRAWIVGIIAILASIVIFLIPFAFALTAIPTTLGVVWLFANAMELSTYVTQLVSLIGTWMAPRAPVRLLCAGLASLLLITGLNLM